MEELLKRWWNFRPESERKYGICPFMSSSAVLPASNLAMTDGSMNVTVAPVLVPCVGEACMAFERHTSTCGMTPRSAGRRADVTPIKP